MKYLGVLARSVCAAVLLCSAVGAKADALPEDGQFPSAAWQEINPEPWIGFVEMTFYNSEGVLSIGFTSIRAPWNRLGATFVYRDY